jgi:hypothetical protein
MLGVLEGTEFENPRRLAVSIHTMTETMRHFRRPQ